MKKKSKLLLLSLVIGLIITALTGLIGPRCVLAEPGGVTNGWRGLPLPYYECGIWGDTIYKAGQCIRGEYHICIFEDIRICEKVPFCFVETVVLPILIILIDICFWVLLSYFVIKKLKKIKL